MVGRLHGRPSVLTSKSMRLSRYSACLLLGLFALQVRGQDDSYEPNDTLQTAYSPLPSATWLSTISGQGIQLDDDWYEIYVSGANGLTVQVDCRFAHANGDIDMSLHRADGGFVAFASQSSTDDEWIEAEVPEAGHYYIKVYYYLSGGTTNTYDLRWSTSSQSCPPDPYEVNNSSGSAYVFTNRNYWLSTINGMANQCDDDYYALEVSPSDPNRLVVECSFSHSQGNINLALYDATNGVVAGAFTTNDLEQLDVAVAGPGIYYLRVYGGDAGNDYDLRWNTDDIQTPITWPVPDVMQFGTDGRLIIDNPYTDQVFRLERMGRTMEDWYPVDFFANAKPVTYGVHTANMEVTEQPFMVYRLAPVQDTLLYAHDITWSNATIKVAGIDGDGRFGFHFIRDSNYVAMVIADNLLHSWMGFQYDTNGLPVLMEPSGGTKALISVTGSTFSLYNTDGVPMGGPYAMTGITAKPVPGPGATGTVVVGMALDMIHHTLTNIQQGLPEQQDLLTGAHGDIVRLIEGYGTAAKQGSNVVGRMAMLSPVLEYAFDYFGSILAKLFAPGTNTNLSFPSGGVLQSTAFAEKYIKDVERLIGASEQEVKDRLEYYSDLSFQYYDEFNATQAHPYKGGQFQCHDNHVPLVANDLWFNTYRTRLDYMQLQTLIMHNTGVESGFLSLTNFAVILDIYIDGFQDQVDWMHDTLVDLWPRLWGSACTASDFETGLNMMRAGNCVIYRINHEIMLRAEWLRYDITGEANFSEKTGYFTDLFQDLTCDMRWYYEVPGLVD